MRPNHEAIGALKNLFKLDAALFETGDIGWFVDELEFAGHFPVFQAVGDFKSKDVVEDYVPIFDSANFGDVGDFPGAVGQLFMLDDEV